MSFPVLGLLTLCQGEVRRNMRDTREEKECCRAIHLQSGLPYDMHKHSFPFACLSLSFDRKAPLGDKTQWEALTKEPVNGTRACFG